MRDRLRLAAAYALIGVCFAVLTYPSFEGMVFAEVRKRTDVTMLAALTFLLAALCGLYGYVAHPRIVSGRPTPTWMHALVIAGGVFAMWFVPWILRQAGEGYDSMSVILASASALFLALAFAATARAARFASSDDTLVARADRRAMFRNALAISTIPYLARWPNRPFTLATFGTHWPIWVPFATTATIAVVLSLDVVDLVRAARHTTEGSYRGAHDPIGEPRQRLRTNALASFAALVVTLAVLAFVVKASR